MKQPLPFDEKNAQDYVEITRKIRDALGKIRRDKHLAATKVNLARLSGVHRNTLYNRAVNSSPDDCPDNGWPFRDLAEIKKARSRPAFAAAEEQRTPSPEDQAQSLQKQLGKSRYIAGTWFHRALELKQQRDEARRQIELLMEQIERHKREIERLRKQAVGTIKVVTQ